MIARARRRSLANPGDADPGATESLHHIEGNAGLTSAIDPDRSERPALSRGEREPIGSGATSSRALGEISCEPVAERELLDPRFILPTWHLHPRKQAAAVFDATRQCPPAPLATRPRISGECKLSCSERPSDDRQRTFFSRASGALPYTGWIMKMLPRFSSAILGLFLAISACSSESKLGEECDESGGDGECESGSVCGKNTGDALVCIKSCVEQTDCPADQECNGVDGNAW